LFLVSQHHYPLVQKETLELSKQCLHLLSQVVIPTPQADLESFFSEGFWTSQNDIFGTTINPVDNLRITSFTIFTVLKLLFELPTSVAYATTFIFLQSCHSYETCPQAVVKMIIKSLLTYLLKRG